MFSTDSEIPQEIEFLSGFLLDQLPTLPRSLQRSLLNQLFTRYLPNHWYPHQSERGSGFRAISYDPTRQDGYLDPVLRLIASEANITPKELKKSLVLNIGWTIWCDPGCVSIRYQSGGGELRELWGSLPQHLAPVGGSSPHALSTTCSPSQLSPCKSRAIPILAPSTATRLAGVTGLAVTPPTPLPEQRANEFDDELDDADLTLHMNRPFTLRPSHSRQASKHSRGDLTELYSSAGTSLSPTDSNEDPFLRPDSRTSSASSSSGSNHSAFSAVSISTTSTVPPTARHVSKPSISGAQPISHPPQMFVRHHSTSSLPYNLPAAKVSHFQAHPYVFPGHSAPGFITQPMISRSSSPAGGRRLRERHYSSASISSVTSNGSTTRHGGLVLKEGPGTVTEHSGGKVGVMGGGVLLGLPKTEGSNNSDKTKSNSSGSNRRGGRRGRASQHQFSLSGLSHFQ